VVPIVLADLGSAATFVWAQLAAVREIGRAAGSLSASPSTTPTVAAILGGSLLAALCWRARPWTWVTRAGGALLLGLLAAGLGSLWLATTPRWDRVWAEVASRPRFSFPSPLASAGAARGHPVRGPTSAAVVTVAEEQRLTLLGRGVVRFEGGDGARWHREVVIDTELTLRPGDRLVLPDGFPVRFQPGRRIPGAPASGPDWADPAGGLPDWRDLVGLGVTVLAGSLGLAATHASLPGGSGGRPRAARLGGVLAVGGLVLTVLWGLYAVWLTPEVYVAGVAGIEVFELPARVAALGRAGPVLLGLTLAGLAAGALGAGVAALRAVPDLRTGAHRHRVGAWLRLGIAILGSALAAATDVSPWPLWLAALGIGAAAVAPVAVLACWAERVTARALHRGAWVGLTLFGVTSLVALALGWEPGVGPGGWLGWPLAWPAVVAVPANLLAAWLAGARPPSSGRAPLAPGLADLHG
jgi:hypothetical protein